VATAHIVMKHPVACFLAKRFPELGRPRYQTVLERLSFLTIASTLIGLLTLAFLLLLYEL
jgi:hypothetical protein